MTLAITLFGEHLLLGLIAAGAVISASVITVAGTMLNRKMTRVEIAVNGRIDTILTELKEARDGPDAHT